jgi:hypothetical protein
MSDGLFDKIQRITPLIRAEIGVMNARLTLPPGVQNNTEIDFHEDRMTRSLVGTLRSYLVKGVHQEQRTTHLTTPATWWDHFKEAKFPAWLLKRFPVKYTERPFTYESQTRICPHADFSWGDQSHIDFLTYSDADGGVHLSEEWLNRFNDAMLGFNPMFWGDDLTKRVFDVIEYASRASGKITALTADLESRRQSTNMWRKAEIEKEK